MGQVYEVHFHALCPFHDVDACWRQRETMEGAQPKRWYVIDCAACSPTCRMCGNDDVCEGFLLCSDCLERFHVGYCDLPLSDRT